MSTARTGDSSDPAAILAGWRETEQAATPGPWASVRGVWEENETFPAVIASDGDPAKAETWLIAAGRGSADPEANAEFTAIARTTMPRLLKAVEAVLKLADDAEEVRDYSGPETHGRLVGWRLNPAQLREAISSALTGTQLGEDGKHGH